MLDFLWLNSKKDTNEKNTKSSEKYGRLSKTKQASTDLIKTHIDKFNQREQRKERKAEQKIIDLLTVKGEYSFHVIVSRFRSKYDDT